MKLLWVLPLLLLNSCRAIDASESIAKDFSEIKTEMVPAIKNVAASVKVIRSFIAPSGSVVPTDNGNGEEIEAIQSQLRNRGIWATLLTLLIGYRFVGGRKVNVAGVGKGIWGAIRGAMKGVAGAMGKAMPNGEKKA